MRSIVMTAGCSGCGTAAVTAAVARQLALQGKKVLLVEAAAGLRRMNRLLEIREEGLFDFSDLLEGRCALENALLPTRIAGLTLLQGPSAIDWVPEAADVQLLPVARKYSTDGPSFPSARATAASTCARTCSPYCSYSSGRPVTRVQTSSIAR